MLRLFLLLLGFVSLVAPGSSRAEEPPGLDSLFAAPALELPALEGAVLQRNPSLAAMRAAWRATESRADRVGAWEDPRVEGTVAPRSFGSSTVDPGFSVQISQAVPLFGQRSLMGKATRAMARSMGEDYRGMRLEVLRMARELYFQLYLAARSAEVNRELAGLVEQFRRVALQKYAAGTAGQQDALQAELEAAMLDHQIVAVGRTRREIQARLRALLHDGSMRDLPDPPRDLPHMEHDLADTTFDIALGNRPELRARRAAIEARRIEIAAAGRTRLPELTVLARYDRFMEEPEWRTVVGAGITLPIWFGKTGAGLREARWELRRAEQEELAVQDSIRAEVEVARSRVHETSHELSIIESRVVPASERALASVRAGYESNRSDFLALLTAERDLARARLDRFQSIAEVHMALADLERAVGLEPERVKEAEESR